MKQQLKWIILTCFVLTFFGCESLPRTNEVRIQQLSYGQIFSISYLFQSKVPGNFFDPIIYNFSYLQPGGMAFLKNFSDIYKEPALISNEFS